MGLEKFRVEKKKYKNDYVNIDVIASDMGISIFPVKYKPKRYNIDTMLLVESDIPTVKNIKIKE